MLRAAEDQAQGHRVSGQIWGNAVANVGDIASGAVSQYQEQKAMSKRDQAVADLWQRSNGNPDVKDLVQIYGKDGVKLASELAQFNAAKANPRRDAISQFPAVAGIMSKLGPQLQEAFWNNEVIPVGKAAGIIAEDVPWKPGIERELLAGFMPQESAPDTAVVEGNLVDKRTGKAIFTAPPKSVEAQPRVVGRSLVGPTGEVIYRDPESKPSGSDNKIWVMRPGKDGKMQTVFVPESQVQAGDQPANTRSGEGRPSLGGEKSALGFFNRAKQADEELKGLTEQISAKNLGGQAWMALAPNFLQTQEGQAYQQAEQNV